MEKSYDIEIDIFDLDSVKQFENTIKDLKERLKSPDLMKFLAKKCLDELDIIMAQKLRTEDYTTNYRESNKYEINGDELTIYNDSKVDLSELSEEALSRYPEGLSLSKLIEFGTGIPRYRK